jgi:hypothetical protein
MSNCLWIHHSLPRSIWYELDIGTRESILKLWEEEDSRAIVSGAMRMGKYSVRGQSDFSSVEVWKFSDIENVVKFWNQRVRNEYSKWFAFSNEVGVEQPHNDKRFKE